MLVQHSVYCLSLATTLASAGLLPSWLGLERREDICGTTGFANSDSSYFWSSNGALTTYTGCSTRCADDTRCKSFGYNSGLCMLFDKSLSTSLTYYTQSDVVYFDVGCVVDGSTGANSQSPLSQTSHKTHISLSRSRKTVTGTRTHTMNGFGSMPTGSGNFPAPSLDPHQTGSLSSGLMHPTNTNPGKLIPDSMSAQPTMHPNSASNTNDEDVERRDLKEAVQMANPAPASTLVTVTTPLGIAVPATTAEVAKADYATFTSGTFTPPTSFPWPLPTGIWPQGGKQNGSTHACPGGGRLGTAAVGTKQKRWFFSWPGIGSFGPKGAHNGTGPAGFGGCSPRNGFRFSH